MAAFVRNGDDALPGADREALIVAGDPSGYVVEWQIETSSRERERERRSGRSATLTRSSRRER